jgi:acyl carrier protein
MLDLVQSLETAFKISIPHYEVSPENFETLSRLAEYVGGKLSSA